MISKSYRNTLMFRWSVATAAAIALFWTVWYLVNGSVPVVNEIKLTSTWSVPLPFAMSRWWDILIGPIWSVAIIYLITKRPLFDDDIILLALIACLGVSLVAALVASLVTGLVACLGVGLVAGLVAGLGVGLGAGLVAGLIVLWRWLVPNKPGDGKTV